MRNLNPHINAESQLRRDELLWSACRIKDVNLFSTITDEDLLSKENRLIFRRKFRMQRRKEKHYDN